MSTLSKELKRFFCAGIAAVSTDYFFYMVLINFVEISISKAISFLLGTVVAYIINKFWTFEKKEKSLFELIAFLGLYSTTLIVNVSVNKVVLIVLPGFKIIGFLCATGTSMVLNFIGQKWFVFKNK